MTPLQAAEEELLKLRNQVMALEKDLREARIQADESRKVAGNAHWAREQAETYAREVRKALGNPGDVAILDLVRELKARYAPELSGLAQDLRAEEHAKLKRMIQDLQEKGR